MGGIYTRICRLLNTYDVPNAPWKPLAAALALAVCIGITIYNIAKVVMIFI